MDRTINSEILVAYSQCPRKAFLLMCSEEQGTQHEYVRILEQKRRESQSKFIDMLKQKNPDVKPYNVTHLNNGADFLINTMLKADGLEAECGVLTKIEGQSALGKHSYEPTLFVGTYRISKEQKLELLFAGHVLAGIQNKPPSTGRVVGADGKSHRVKLENSDRTLMPPLEPLREWVEAPSPEPPPVILNKHCSICQFQTLCRAQAEDNLSLLDRVTRKVIQKYEKKGIFTVKQLSCTFKPRKRKKRTKNPPPPIHKPELQALAIRTGKIYLQDLPDLTRKPTELFLDIEGIPDQQFHYLIGVLVCEGDKHAYHAFWADTADDEATIWKQFLETVNKYPEGPIYHYGSYEPKAIVKFAKRYETDAAPIKNRLVNVNSYIYGKVYFPTQSNGLKELGDFIGASWTSADASGLQSLVWRHHWEAAQQVIYREQLITYNREDCEALKLLTDELSKIKHSADTLSEVDFADQPKSHATEVGIHVHSQFKEILKFAYLNYDKKKISFSQPQKRKESKEQKRERDKQSAKKLHQKYINTRRKAAKIIQVPDDRRCYKCGHEPLRPTELVSSRVIVDFVVTKNGIRKTITEYLGFRAYCPKCYAKCAPSDIRRYGSTQLYGHGVIAWIIYQRVALRLPYEGILESLDEQFNEKMTVNAIPRFIHKCACDYAETQEIIAQGLLESSLIHVDETTINIKGADWYVWVFTNERYVTFQLKETREATIVHELLADYQGTMVSDFYPGYDSVPCRQQKCWVHLIRDVNSDLRANPFDTEFERFVLELRDLIIPIMEAVQKYGLKQRNLNKFRKQVDQFYKKVITDKRYRSEVTLKYQNRFIRYRHSLFTFLEQSGIPWHNNAAERAIRHVAIQNAMSSTLCESVTQDYLVLLGIRQTCRFQGKSFFKFLFSGEKDIDQFKERKR